MKRAVLILSICLLSGLSWAATMVDDFESYTPGSIVSPWVEETTDVAAIEADAGNQFITYGDNSGDWKHVYRPMGSEVSTTTTLFFTVYVAAETGLDHAFGITDEDAPTWYSAYGPYFRITDDTAAAANIASIDVYNTAGNGWVDDQKSLTVGQWYNIWLVINPAGGTKGTSNLYCNQGTADATSTDLVYSGSGFRKTYATPMDVFLLFAGSAALKNVRVDNVYLLSGEDLSYPMIPVSAHNPTPSHGATDVALETTTVSWYTGVDPDNPESPDPNITKHYVYMREGDPNLKYITPLEVNAGDPVEATASCLIADLGITLTIDKTYYWRVDESVNDSGPADSNTIAGSIWRFEAVKSVPQIQTQPKNTTAAPTESAQFTIKATVAGTLGYEWYYSADAVVGDDGDSIGDANTLTIDPVALDDEGYYYCKVFKVGNEDNPVTSDMAKLGVERKMAHWTLDLADYTGGQYVDINTEDTVQHNADPNGTPVFVNNINDVADSAVAIDPINGYASAGTWNPSEMTGQFSFSLWAKWAGQGTTTTWQGLLSKETSYGADMMWQLEVVSAAQDSSTVMLKNGLESGNLTIDPLAIDTWEHLAVTWDGTTATIYRNGENAASGTWSPGTKTDAPVNIGISARSLTENLMFNGALDDVKIWNHALTQQEVIDEYHAVTGKSACVDKPTYDFDDDCMVTLSDFAMMAAQWLTNGLYPEL